ncbi:MAG: amidohydrolase family protein [Acidimicrobiales bacterium]|nr:amidohydrolase family protein [Acidimicrobiales bacterium]
MISSDSHVCERPDLFTTRAPARLRDRMPYVVQEEGVDYWVLEDDVKGTVAGNSTGAGDRFDWDSRPPRQTFEDIRPGAYDPEAFLSDNEQDGVWGAVLYPTQALLYYSLMSDPEVRRASFDAVNGWIIEFAAKDPGRLKPVVLLDTDEPAYAARELERLHELGAAGANIPVWQDADHSYDGREYEPLWTAAEGLGVPLSMHIATNRPPFGKILFSYSQRATLADYWVRKSLADLIFGGVFERHPALRVGSVENEAGWAAHFVTQIDHNYKTNYRVPERVRFKDGKLPTDFFRENVFVSYSEDRAAIMLRDYIGINNLMWGNDYPHGESTFPRSRQIVAEQLSGVGVEDQYLLTCGNVAHLYDFRLPAEVASAAG